MYTDNPSPGAGLMAVNIISIIILILIPIIFRHRLLERRGMLPVIVIICLAGVITFAVIIHGLLNTSYSIDGGTLSIRNGIILKGDYDIADIKSVRMTVFNSQAFGSAFSLRGYCNRLTRGLRITTSDRIIFISPSNPPDFMAELKKRMGMTGV